MGIGAAGVALVAVIFFLVRGIKSLALFIKCKKRSTVVDAKVGECISTTPNYDKREELTSTTYVYKVTYSMDGEEVSKEYSFDCGKKEKPSFNVGDTVPLYYLKENDKLYEISRLKKKTLQEFAGALIFLAIFAVLETILFLLYQAKSR